MELVLGKRRKRRMELKPKTRELRAMGLSFQEIADTLGIDTHTAHRWAKDVQKGNLENG